MKKVLFTTMMLIGICLSATAQEEELFYYSDAKAEMQQIRDFIDRKTMIYRFDGDSEEDCTMEMRNNKKNGNTETFEIYQKLGEGKGRKKGHRTVSYRSGALNVCLYHAC